MNSSDRTMATLLAIHLTFSAAFAGTLVYLGLQVANMLKGF